MIRVSSMSLIATAAIALGISIPAEATIVIYSSPGAVMPDQNVLFNGPDPVGMTAFGNTNQTNTSVTFTGMENLATPSNGQARITGIDGNLSALSFGLTDSLLAFRTVEFNIFRQQSNATSTTLNFTDQFGEVFTQVFALGNGQNFFSAEGIDGQLITNVSFTANGDVRDVRQVRLGEIQAIVSGAVPEPATWAMMIGGVGMVGGAVRRRRVSTKVSFA